MTPRELAKMQRLYDALKRITKYATPDQLRREARGAYGLDSGEAIEMAYENVIEEAKRAVKGMKRPVAKP